MLNQRLTNSYYLIPFFILCLNFESFGLTTVKADNPNFQYTGRIDFSVPDQPVIFWPGTYIRANFEGSLVILMFDDQTGQSYYNVFIDEDYEHPHVVDCNAGSQIYLISATLTDTVHNLLIFRRTEASTCPTKFLGIQISDGKTLVAPPPRPERKLLFYGNSITCGYGNEAPDNGADDNLAQENNFLSYGAITSRLLNADYMCIAKSGIGIMISWFPTVMSEYYYRLNPDDVASNWDFNEYIPDVVVINLFQNDSWLINNLHPVPDSSQRVAAYADFVRTIRSRHPNAFLVCSLGSMDATKAGSPWPGYISSAVEKLKTEDNDTNLGTFFFPFDPSWTKHPRVRHHLVMGHNLADYISGKMGWATDVENNFAVQPPSNFKLFQNYPNPFNPTTKISWQSAVGSWQVLKVFDILGNKIVTLVDEYRPAGSYEVEFNAVETRHGVSLPSGAYFYQLRAGDFISVKKMLLLK
jgi:hypothetical protein